MNLHNLNRAISMLEQVQEHCPHRFNMCAWFLGKHNRYHAVSELHASWAAPATEPCGTVACLGGWIQLSFAETQEQRQVPAGCYANGFLELSKEESNDLFLNKYHRYGDLPLREISISEVLTALKDIAAKGVIELLPLPRQAPDSLALSPPALASCLPSTHAG